MGEEQVLHCTAPLPSPGITSLQSVMLDWIQVATIRSPAFKLPAMAHLRLLEFLIKECSFYTYPESVDISEQQIGKEYIQATKNSLFLTTVWLNVSWPLTLM